MSTGSIRQSWPKRAAGAWGFSGLEITGENYLSVGNVTVGKGAAENAENIMNDIKRDLPQRRSLPKLLKSTSSMRWRKLIMK